MSFTHVRHEEEAPEQVPQIGSQDWAIGLFVPSSKYPSIGSHCEVILLNILKLEALQAEQLTELSQV